jgi:hypothetical protein
MRFWQARGERGEAICAGERRGEERRGEERNDSIQKSEDSQRSSLEEPPHKKGRKE